MARRKSELAMIPLGGVGEIGKNMIVFEYGEDIIVIDSGVAFPGDELPGVDLVIPDFRYLVENKEKIKAIFITHGHEDHIGALPYVLKELNIPVYGTRLTLGLVKKKLEDERVTKDIKLVEITPRDTVEAGAFSVEFFRINHSIPDGVGLAIHTPEGVIIHSGDFKLDHTPIDGRVTELHKLAAYGQKGVLAMICDCTGVDNAGFTPSEKIVGQTFQTEFEKARGRIIVATFASNVHRIQQVINAAMEHNRKIAIGGRSMVNVVEAALDLGYLDCPETMLIELDQVDRLRPEEVVIITTGSQGEPMAALTRIAEGSHRQIVLQPGDTVIVSATPIPGNAKNVYRTINNLYKGGARVVYRDVAPVHVSGHAAQEEIKMIFSLIKPRYAVPFHGEYRHLVRLQKLVMELGIPESNVIISSLGDKIVFSKGKVSIQGKVESGSILIDGLGVGDVGNIVLRDRKNLSENGVVIVVLTLDKESGSVLAGPDIVSRGFIYVRDSDELMAKMQLELNRAVKGCEEKHIRDWSVIKERIRTSLVNVMYTETKRKPLVLPIIMEA